MRAVCSPPPEGQRAAGEPIEEGARFRLYCDLNSDSVASAAVARSSLAAPTR
jgi:hypothetical protein